MHAITLSKACCYNVCNLEVVQLTKELLETECYGKICKLIGLHVQVYAQVSFTFFLLTQSHLNGRGAELCRSSGLQGHSHAQDQTR